MFCRSKGFCRLVSDLPLNLNNRILVIHSDSFIRELLEFNLERMGYNVELIQSARLVIDQLESRGTPRLVIMDLSLPYRSGLEVIKSLRNALDWRSVPILVLTRQKSARKVEQAFRQGASDYVKIPFDLRELKARIKRLVGRRP